MSAHVRLLDKHRATYDAMVMTRRHERAVALANRHFGGLSKVAAVRALA